MAEGTGCQRRSPRSATRALCHPDGRHDHSGRVLYRTQTQNGDIRHRTGQGPARLQRMHRRSHTISQRNTRPRSAGGSPVVPVSQAPERRSLVGLLQPTRRLASFGTASASSDRRTAAGLARSSGTDCRTRSGHLPHAGGRLDAACPPRTRRQSVITCHRQWRARNNLTRFGFEYHPSY